MRFQPRPKLAVFCIRILRAGLVRHFYFQTYLYSTYLEAYSGHREFINKDMSPVLHPPSHQILAVDMKNTLSPQLQDMSMVLKNDMGSYAIVL